MKRSNAWYFREKSQQERVFENEDLCRISSM